MAAAGAGGTVSDMVSCLVAAVMVLQAAPAPPTAGNPPPKKLLEAPRLAPVVVKDARTNFLRGTEEAPAPAEAPPAEEATAPAEEAGVVATTPEGGDPPEAWPSSNAAPPVAGMAAPPMATPAPAAPPPAPPAGNATGLVVAAIAALVMITGPAIGAHWALGRQLPPKAH